MRFDSPTPSSLDVFEVLVSEHADRLSAYLHGQVSDPGAVDDLFQETLLRAWQGLGSYDRTRPFGPWLRGIAGKLILQHRARLGRRPEAPDPEQRLLDQAFDELDGEPFGEALEALERCLSQLPPAFGQVLELAYQGGLGLQAVAARLGLGVETVKKRLQRGRARLGECLRRAGVSA